MCYIFTLINKFKANISDKTHALFQKVPKNSHHPGVEYSEGQFIQPPLNPSTIGSKPKEKKACQVVIWLYMYLLDLGHKGYGCM